MVNTPHCPRRGDVVWVSFDTRPGHEQAGRRPALILSPETYNRKTGLAVLCPITSHKKGYPFEVEVPSGYEVRGVILSDHVKNVDWRARHVEFCCQLPSSVTEDVAGKLSVLIV